MALADQLLAPHDGADHAVRNAVEQLLQAALAEARARWPTLTIDPSRLVRRLAAALADEPDVVASLSRLHSADVCLAGACLDGDAAAIELFERELLSRVAGFVARVDRTPAFADEVRQRLRESLLVGRQERPGLAGYRGRGALAAWVHVAALRMALNLRREERRARGASFTPETLMAEGEPELDFLQRRYRDDFRQAFQAALAALDPAARRLLRLALLDGLSLSQIGAIERIDKSNVSRRLSAVREELFVGTRDRLGARLGMGEGELESLLGAIHSGIEVSLERLLRRSSSG